MLAGRYATTRIRELKPRISMDRIDNTVKAKKGALLALYLSGGSIPNRGNYALLHNDTGSRIGDLDEEFVWEAKIGQVFTLGTQNWKIQRITHNDVFVIPASPTAIAAPFWRAEALNRNFQFSEQISTFLETADAHLADCNYEEDLRRDHFMDADSARYLIGFLKKQREVTSAALPHRHHLLIEFSGTGPGDSPGNQVILHTGWGGCVNRPFALALDRAWEEKYGARLEIFAGNECIVFLLPHSVTAIEILSLVSGEQVEALLRERLEGSGYFGARFRECAGRALLLTKTKFNERLPLWMTRLRSQKLMESIFRHDDFPILLEAWRTCLHDEFDLPALHLVLQELEQGVISWTETTTSRPSPMGRDIAFSQISQYMYQDDSPLSNHSSHLNQDLMNEIIFNQNSRPTISKDLIRKYEEKRQRLFSGYTPSTARDLLDWIKERVALPIDEWKILIQAIQQDHQVELKEFLNPVLKKLIQVSCQNPVFCTIVAKERLFEILDLLNIVENKIEAEDLDGVPVVLLVPDNIQKEEVMDIPAHHMSLLDLLSEWLSFYGPLSLKTICQKMGLSKQRALPLLEDLAESKQVVKGKLVRFPKRTGLL